MADILIDVKVQGTQDVLKAQSAMSSVTSAAAKLASEMDKGRLTSQAYFKGQNQLIQILTKAGFSYKQAQKAIFDYTKALRDQAAANAAADAAKKLADRNEYLRRTYQQGYAAFARARTQMRELREAMRNGIITTEQYRDAVQRLREEQARQNAQGQRSTRTIGQLGTITQQAGYQVGDFVVQVQSGTNAFVAFGQQATQIAGTLTLLGGKWIFIGSALGVAIPLITAYLAYTQRASGASDNLQKKLEKLTDAVDNYNGSLDRLENQDLEDKFGNLTGDIIHLTEVMSDLNDVAQMKSLVSFFEKVEEQASAGTFRMLDAQFAQGIKNIRAFINPFKSMVGADEVAEKENQKAYSKLGLDMAREQFLSYTQELQKLAQSGDREGVVSLLATMFEDATNGANELSDTGLVLLGNLEKSALATAELAARINGSAQAARELKDAQQAVADAQADLLEGNLEYEEAQEKVRQKLVELYELVKATHVAYIPMSQEARTFKAETEAQISNFVTLVDKTTELKEDIGEAAYEALRLAGVDMVSGVDAAAKAAAILAANLGLSLQAAMAMQAMTADEDTVMSQPVVKGNIFSRFGEEDLKRFGFSEEVLKRFGVIKGKKKGGGSKQTPEEKADDYLRKLELEAEYKQKIIGLSEREARTLEIKTELEKKKLPIDDERIQQIVNMEEKTRKLMEAEKQREQLMNTIEGHIENAFMSMVDGSKSVEDAFKSMLRNIILAIYQEKVAKAGANAIMSLLGLANGGAFERGGKFTAYANGGVVGSPTMFSHSGGLGVMGEAGPEAIMPLKRGKNGKLGVQMEGSGGDVVINQSFNFAANGDESVKRIIRGEVPRITEATKVAVLDAKRRGGSYGRAF